MGGGSTKYVKEYVYQVDNCRPPIMEKAMEWTRDAARNYERCAQQATSKMWSEMQAQQMQMNQDTYQSLLDASRRMRNRLRADARFCYNIEKKYKPFGIEGPVGLECHKIEDHDQGCRLKNPDSYDNTCEGENEIPTENIPRSKDKNGKLIPNVVVIGNTGIGKSYYANGLMGSLDPDNGFFGTSDSHGSCTRGVRGVSGWFYGRKLQAYFNPIRINLYDTPGFADSDPCQIEKNKERIAATLGKPIHAFIFMADHTNSRIDANQQKLFKMLNEWTMGNIWNNLIVGYPRMTFDHNDRMNRLDQQTSFHKQLQTKKEKLKQTLWKIASEQEWKKRDRNDNLVSMQLRDFDNIRVNALNVHQNKVCEFADDGRIDRRSSDLERCNQLAIFDENLDYVMNESPADNDQYHNPFAMDPFARFSNRPEYDLHDDEWVFIEEAQKLQQIIKEFSKHPVATQKLYWEGKYKQELQAYFKRYNESEIQLNTEAFDAAGIDTKHCEEARDKRDGEIKHYKAQMLAKCPKS